MNSHEVRARIVNPGMESSVLEDSIDRGFYRGSAPAPVRTMGPGEYAAAKAAERIAAMRSAGGGSRQH